jgi:N-acetylglucosaminyl-diphospho-decaprenol L-rhamnosyltransferase
MRISLITVCHKSRVKIAAYVQSFLEHHKNESDRSRYQFIFVENSGDTNFHETVQPLVDGGFDVVVLNSENEGFGRGCNTGAQFASGDLLVFANPDIRFLCNLGALLDQSPPIAWGTVRQVTLGDNVCSVDLLTEHKGLLFELLQLNRLVNRYPAWFLRYCYVVGSFMIISKKLFEWSGGFDPTFFLYHEEAEFARRLQTLSGPPRLIQTVSIFHEGFGSHSSRDDVLKHEATGFLTYCHVTRQPALIQKRLKIFRVLGLLSGACKKRYRILRDAALLQHS